MSRLMETQQKTRNGNHAIVIGSGMAGLLSARILTEHFERVTVVERDRLPQQPEIRQGVPQANHVHALLTQGYRILEEWFPGIEAKLITAGAPCVNWAMESCFFHAWGCAKRSSSDLITRTCSRPFLEWVVRGYLSSDRQVEFLSATQVKGLLTDASNSRVTGIKLRCLDDAQPQELTSDLVVDASGRNSVLPKWLEEIGYQSPSETVINSFLGYSTCWYELPENLQADWKVLYVTSKPPDDKRGGAIFPVEGNRWGVILVGISRDYPPTDETEFMKFARSLRTPEIYEFLKDAKPVSPIYGYRRTENCWRHYEKLTRIPDGLVAIGDAVCSFNPVYGQGMTTAALGALTLQDCLQKQYQNNQHSLTGFTKRFQKQLVKVLETPWLMATGEDFRWETTEGGKPNQITRLMHQYMDRLLQLSVSDANIYGSFLEVMHMTKQPASLFAPNLLLRVLKNVGTK
ncbi:2-polyprenyl-6-methoxyphenol hydroxylase-like oxidoreductase [Fischerella thermalis CCMEE 5201]|nr:2-polyprenyl-6-methoxyphenol hydroxylase-like oxidoreductase [Fischerella thermalis CCMEE 5201]